MSRTTASMLLFLACCRYGHMRRCGVNRRHRSGRRSGPDDADQSGRRAGDGGRIGAAQQSPNQTGVLMAINDGDRHPFWFWKRRRWEAVAMRNIGDTYVIVRQPAVLRKRHWFCCKLGGILRLQRHYRSPKCRGGYSRLIDELQKPHTDDAPIEWATEHRIRRNPKLSLPENAGALTNDGRWVWLEHGPPDVATSGSTLKSMGHTDVRLIHDAREADQIVRRINRRGPIDPRRDLWLAMIGWLIGLATLALVLATAL